MKKRVGIVTIHRAHNAGAALQAFALSEAVTFLGHECEIIDYWPHEESRTSLKALMSPRVLNYHLQNFLFHEKRRRAELSFCEFQNLMPIASPTLRTAEEVERAGLDNDVFVCGSDQIWNPSRLLRGAGKPYYLSFAVSGKSRRVSYAPSFGVDSIPIEQRSRMAELIGVFDSISAREKSGVRLVEELTGRKAEHVLDPTLLVQPETFYGLVKEPPIDLPYMFVYPTQYPRKPEHLAVLRSVARKFGLRVVVSMGKAAHPKWFLAGQKILMDIGPRQFLGLIQKASVVVTNSYHGTALSIAFRKNFAVIPHAHFNTRMESLLDILDLKHRMMADDTSPSNMSAYLQPVDYEKVEGLLFQERRKSLDFLRRAIEG